MKRLGMASLAFSLVAAGGVTFAGVHDARACGGCFTPPEETESVITDEKMILSISMDTTTLYDEIEYSGAPASFAWVLPIKGTVTVGLSADLLFQTLEQLTATEVVQPTYTCPTPASCSNYNAYGPSASGATLAAADAGGKAATVTVTAQAQVGPYETVQLHSTDGSALTSWLTSHGYQIPASTKPIIDAYVSQQFDFLALKLVPGTGVQAMQPVRVTSHGAAPSLPLHMVAIGTGATTGITIWVVADGRWQPTNFPTFTIADSELSWDWATSSSNYESVRLAKEAKYSGRGWQIESSLDLNQQTVIQTIEQTIEYGSSTVGGYTAPVATTDGGAPDAGSGDAGGGVAAASADLAVLFNGISGSTARFTRMRSDVAQSALSVDMALAASSDQGELTNLHYPTKQIGEPTCPIYNDECEVTGSAPLSQAQAAAQAASVGGGGCTTSRPPSEPGTAAGALLALAGIGIVRARRKRTGSRTKG